MLHSHLARRALRAVLLVAIAGVTWEACARIQDQVTLGVPATKLHFTRPPLYAYDAVGPHGIPNARDGKFHINSLGFRGPELQPGRITVLCLGASETFGVSESADHEYPRQLEDQLNKNGPPRFQVVNAALPGERLDDIAKTLPATLRATHPAIAVLYASSASAVWTDERWNAMHPTPATKDPPPEISGRSRAAERLRSLITNALPEPITAWQRKRAVTAAIAAAHVEPAAELPDENFRAFRHDFDQVLGQLAAAHVRTIVVTHATRFGPNGAIRDDQVDVFRTYYPVLTEAGIFNTERRFNAVVRSVARKHGRPVVDAARRIAPGPANFADFFHFTDRGSGRMAQLIAAALDADLAKKPSR